MAFDLTAFADQFMAELQETRAVVERLDTKGAATLLKVSEDTVGKWVAQGLIPGRKLEHRWRFRRSELMDHISPQRQANRDRW